MYQSATLRHRLDPLTTADTDEDCLNESAGGVGSERRYLDENSALARLERALESEFGRDIHISEPAIEAKPWQDTEADRRLLGLIRHYTSLPVGSVDHEKICKDLASALWTCWNDRMNQLASEACILIQTRLLDLHPAGHLDRAALCTDLAASLWTHYNQTGNSALLDKAIELEQEALGLRPTGHPGRAISCTNLALSLRARFYQIGDSALLDRAIELQQEALDLHPTGHPARAISCTNLAALFRARYNQAGDSALLDKAIELEQEALDLRPTGHPDRAISCTNLAISLWTRYNQVGESALLDKAIELQQEALSLRPAGHPGRAVSCTNLAASLQARYNQTGNSALLDKAIELQEEALGLQPAGHPGRAMSCQNLTASLLDRFDMTGNSALLDKAIELAQEALHLRPAGHPDRAMSCHNLAVSVRTRYEMTGDSALLDKAIELQEEVLDLQPAGHPHQAASRGNLALSLRTLYNRTGDSALLDKVIKLQQEELDLQPAGHPGQAILCTNFAASLWTRYNQTGDSALLDKAIELQEEVLDLLSAGHPDRAMSCTNLAASLWTRYNQVGESALLDKAIELQQEALSLRPAGHPGRAVSCTNLAASLRVRYNQAGNSALLDKVIELEQEALDLRPTGHPDRAISCTNLAISLRACFYQAGDSALLDKVIELEQEALLILPDPHPQRWRSYHSLAESSQMAPDGPDWEVALGHLHSMFNAPSYDNINDFYTYAASALHRIDSLTLSHQQQNTLLALYTRALNVMTVAASFALDASTQLQRAQTLNALGVAAFWLALRLDQVVTALQLLDRARGVIWSQLLHMQDPQLDRVPPDLADKMRGLLGHRGAPRGDLIEHNASHQLPDVSARNAVYAQRYQLQDVVQEIRALSGMSDFMRGPDVSLLLSVATRNPVVVLVAGKDTCHAVVMMPNERISLQHVSLADMNQQKLEELALQISLPRNRGSTTADVSENAERLGLGHGKRKLLGPLGKLWQTVVKPIIQLIGLAKTDGRVRPRIHWCPTGSFAFVPLHAAGIYDGPNQECCSGYAVSSYTPTLAALIHARRGQSTFASSQIKALAVSAECAMERDLPHLRHAVSEVAAVVSILTQAGASAHTHVGALTQAEVLSDLESSHIIHLACHGVQDPEPHKSRFCLSTGNLSVASLMNLELKHGILAFLSACETAKGDQKHADEVVHLAAAMLFAGFKSVVATMWAMNDADGPFVAKLFYQRLFEGTTIDMDSIAYALDYAVKALRAKGAPPEQWATFIHMGA